MGRVEGKVAIVTGGASGLGESEAELLGREGAKVIIADIDEDQGKRVADRIGATFVRHDVTSEDDWKTVIAFAEREFGKLDILVNNAAMTRTANVENEDLEIFRKVQQVNVESVFLGCKYGIMSMAKSGGGSIINISSMAAIRGFPEVFAYTVSKGAVLSLSHNVASYCLVAGYDIRCNTVLPGSTLTPMQQAAAKARHGESMVGSDTDRRRTGKPADIGNVVLFLASDESVHITGQEFVVDGGYSIR